MKAVVAAFNQEKALVGAVITNLRMELFQALIDTFTVYILSPGRDERRFFRDKTRAVDVRSWQEIEDINMRGAMKGRI